MKLHHQIIGLASEKPIVILHGLFGSSDNWRGIAKQLSYSARVITVDLRNHGASPHSDKISYQLMADDLVELLDDLGLNKINLIGHSVGGKVAMEFSQHYAERLDKLLVVDIAPKVYIGEHGSIFKTLLDLDLSTVTRRSELDAQLAESIPSKAVRYFLLMNVITENKTLKWRINLTALADNYPFLLEAVCENIEVLTPTLFVRGGRSNYIKQSDEALIKRTFPQSKIATIEQAGHWVHSDEADVFLDITRTFFNYD